MRAIESRPGTSSPCVKPRPLATETPSTSRKLGDALLVTTRVAIPFPVRFICEPVLTAAQSAVRLRCCEKGNRSARIDSCDRELAGPGQGREAGAPSAFTRLNMACIASDSQRKRYHRNRRENGRPAEDARRVSQILQQPLEGSGGSARSGTLPCGASHHPFPVGMLQPRNRYRCRGCISCPFRSRCVLSSSFKLAVVLRTTEIKNQTMPAPQKASHA